jgi:hypothetical protein
LVATECNRPARCQRTLRASTRPLIINVSASAQLLENEFSNADAKEEDCLHFKSDPTKQYVTKIYNLRTLFFFTFFFSIIIVVRNLHSVHISSCFTFIQFTLPLSSLFNLAQQLSSVLLSSFQLSSAQLSLGQFSFISSAQFSFESSCLNRMTQPVLMVML